MKRPVVIEAFKQFRFAFQDENGVQLAVESARWEGTTLILTKALDRRIVEAGMPRAGRLFGALDERPLLYVVIFDEALKPLVWWRIVFAAVVDRGFDFLHAAEDDIVREAVALLNARVSASGAGEPPAPGVA